MNTKLFVGNLSFDTTENDLQDLFTAHGPVTSVDLIMDKMSGRSRGFAFVTMETKEGADAAIQALQGKNVKGRDLTVNEARPREERSGWPVIWRRRSWSASRVHQSLLIRCPIQGAGGLPGKRPHLFHSGFNAHPLRPVCT